MAGAKYNLIHLAYFCLWALCALVELLSAYFHWNKGLRLMPLLLLGPYGHWVRLAVVVSFLSLPVLLCVPVARLRHWKPTRLLEVFLAIVVVTLFLYNMSFIRS